MLSQGKRHGEFLSYLERQIDGIAGGQMRNVFQVQDKKHEFYYRNWLENDDQTSKKSKDDPKFKEIVYKAIEGILEKRLGEIEKSKSLEQKWERTQRELDRLKCEFKEYKDQNSQKIKKHESFEKINEKPPIQTLKNDENRGKREPRQSNDRKDRLEITIENKDPKQPQINRREPRGGHENINGHDNRRIDQNIYDNHDDSQNGRETRNNRLDRVSTNNHQHHDSRENRRGSVRSPVRKSRGQKLNSEKPSSQDNLKKSLEEFPPLGTLSLESKPKSRRSEGSSKNITDKNEKNRRRTTGSRKSDAREIKITIAGLKFKKLNEIPFKFFFLK